ncbi:unnamed protein product [Paramecium sonneborni]|uniref:Transmembrane protein n=1 Tax=Paramecium sonneborni TaxID=65129 RepID=A0A8S1QIZ1_9CILI|nr:unnamed protein product [Paramecium sonneborni]
MIPQINRIVYIYSTIIQIRCQLDETSLSSVIKFNLNLINLILSIIPCLSTQSQITVFITKLLLVDQILICIYIKIFIIPQYINKVNVISILQ